MLYQRQARLAAAKGDGEGRLYAFKKAPDTDRKSAHKPHDKARAIIFVKRRRKSSRVARRRLPAQNRPEGPQ